MVRKSESQHELEQSDKFFFRRSIILHRIALTVSCLIALVLLVGLVIVAASKKDASGNSPGSINAELVKTAAYVLGSIDTSVDPCQDFYEFACGSWRKATVIPDDKSSQNVFGVLRDDVLVKVKELLEDQTELGAKSLMSARRLYSSCLNETSIDILDVQPLATHIFSKVGDWPMISSNWSDKTFDVVETAAQLGLIGARVLWNYWVSSDDKNSTVNIIQFDQPDVGLPSREYFLNSNFSKYLAAYKTFMVSIVRECNRTVPVDQVNKDAEDVIAFEAKVANLTTPRELRRNHESLYNRMSLKEMHSNITDKINWTRFLDITFQVVQMTLLPGEPIVIYNPTYLREIAELIHRTPKRTIANLMMWRLIMTRVKFLPKRFRDKETEYYRVLYGAEVERARWKICASLTNSNMGNAVGRLFVSKYFDEEAKSGALEMIKDIRSSFNDLLNTNTWMDVATRKAAQTKAEAIVEKIGYPDSIMNDTALDEEFSNVNVSGNTYFSNIMSIATSTVAENLRQLRKPVDKDGWSSAPAVVNAFYNTVKNQIVFPAGILQPPFYGKHRPKALNYGAIGMVIGHEITHGFDDQGRQYDKDGNLVQWWSDSADKAFKDKAKCIVNQYSNFTVTQIGMKVNGMRTQGENIADNGGVKQAFKAYRAWVAKNGEEQRLPGVSLTPDQLFFLGFGQVWCGVDKDSSLVNSVATGAHSPGQFRVIGTVSNSEDFSRAYSCKKGSPMNPVDKCSIW